MMRPGREIIDLLRSDMEDLEEYEPVLPLDILAAEIGVAVDDLVKLDANENLYGPIPEIREALARVPLHIYPDPSQTTLREAVAAYVGVEPGQVVAGAGADDLIDIVLRLVQPQIVAAATPTFGMYAFLAKINGAQMIDVPRGDGFALDLPGLASAVRAGAGVVFVTSPNNPTGNPLAGPEMEALAELDALVVIDEAYVEFGGQSAVPLIANAPNVVVLRTFSKWAALAGLRVGYAIADARLARHMMAIKQPYNVNVAGDVAARTALAYRDAIFETVRCIVAERERMARLLGELGWIRPLPSAANFLLCAVEGREARTVAAALRERGVLVRHYNRPELRRYIRISAGRPHDTDRLLAALRAVEAA